MNPTPVYVTSDGDPPPAPSQAAGGLAFATGPYEIPNVTMAAIHRRVLFRSRRVKIQVAVFLVGAVGSSALAVRNSHTRVQPAAVIYSAIVWSCFFGWYFWRLKRRAPLTMDGRIPRSCRTVVDDAGVTDCTEGSDPISVPWTSVNRIDTHEGHLVFVYQSERRYVVVPLHAFGQDAVALQSFLKNRFPERGST